MSRSIVSIISPCYNVEKYVAAFLDSVLAQTYEPIELIVIDDGSTDGTLAVLESYKQRFEKRGFLFTIIHQSHAGAAAAINKGLNIYCGDYLMWVDSDDILCEDNVRDKVEFLEENPDCGFVLCEGERVSGDNINLSLGPHKRVKPLGEDRLFEDLIMTRNVVWGPGTVLVRRRVLEYAIPQGQIYESTEGQNWQLMLPLAYTAKCGYIEKVLFKYVNHKDSHSNRKRTAQELAQRQKGFRCMQENIIRAIPGMNEDERRHWNQVIAHQYNVNVLHIAYGYRKVSLWKAARQSIKNDGDSIGFREGAVCYYFQAVRNRIGRLKARKNDRSNR